MDDEPIENHMSKAVRNPDGTFARGPGRKPGSKNRISREAIEKIRSLGPLAFDTLRHNLDKGDQRAAEYVLDKIPPPPGGGELSNLMRPPRVSGNTWLTATFQKLKCARPPALPKSYNVWSVLRNWSTNSRHWKNCCWGPAYDPCPENPVGRAGYCKREEIAQFYSTGPFGHPHAESPRLSGRN